MTFEEVLLIAADQVVTVVWLKAGLFVAALALTRAALRRASAASRSLVWTLSTAALLLLPVIQHMAPQVVIALVEFPAFLFSTSAGDVGRTLGAAFQGPGAAGSPVGGFPLAGWLGAIYLTGSVLLIGRLGWQTWMLARAARRAAPLDVTGCPGVAVACSAEVSTPLTFGWWRPRILLPVEVHAWPPARLAAVLTHEMAHIRRRDYLTLLLTEIARALYWVNPLVWMLAARTRADLEHACDDAVLREGTAPADYAGHLLGLARGCQPARVASLPMAGRGLFRARLRAILDAGRDRRPVRVRDVIAAALLSVLLVAGLAPAVIWSCPNAAPPPAATATPDPAR